MISHNEALSFDPYLSNDYSLSSSSIYLGAVEALRHGQDHYGLPFYSSVYMLAGSSEFLPEDGVPSYNLSGEELIEYIRSIPGINADGSVYITRFYDAGSLTPFMGEEYSSSLINEGLSSTE